MESRWFRRAGPGIAALGALAFVASTTVGAPEPTWEPPPCSGRPAAGIAASGAWYQLDPVIEGGARTGQRLVVGEPGGARPRTLALDAESFAAGPFGGTVLAGTDDGRRSRLSLIDIGAGCAWAVGTSDDVVRRATIAPDRATVYEFRVDRRARADLGVWRRRLDGRGSATRVLAPIAPDPAFGRTWLTDFAWSDDGHTLAVQSCGEVACRFRLLSSAGGPVGLVADPRLGDAVGLSGDRLVTHGACKGLPCPLIAVDLTDGSSVLLHAAAGQAVLARDRHGRSVVVHEVGADGRSLRTVELDGRELGTAPPMPDGRRLVPGPARSGGAAEHRPDALTFGMDGRLDIDARHAPFLRRLSDGPAVPFDEVP